jgi:hypothetical protein
MKAMGLKQLGMWLAVLELQDRSRWPSFVRTQVTPPISDPWNSDAEQAALIYLPATA